MSEQIPEMDVFQLARLMEAGRPPRLVDIRQPEEFAWCRLPGAELIPLLQLPESLGLLDPEEELVILCHTGARSLTAARYLAGRGFARVWSLAGGIQRWSLVVDPSVPTY